MRGFRKRRGRTEGRGELAMIGQEVGARARLHARQHPLSVLHNTSGRYLTAETPPPYGASAM